MIVCIDWTDLENPAPIGPLSAPYSTLFKQWTRLILNTLTKIWFHCFTECDKFYYSLQCNFSQSAQIFKEFAPGINSKISIVQGLRNKHLRMNNAIPRRSSGVEKARIYLGQSNLKKFNIWLVMCTCVALAMKKTT